jgi:hypothetical protein
MFGTRMQILAGGGCPEMEKGQGTVSAEIMFTFSSISALVNAVTTNRALLLDELKENGTDEDKCSIDGKVNLYLTLTATDQKLIRRTERKIKESLGARESFNLDVDR